MRLHMKIPIASLKSWGEWWCTPSGDETGRMPPNSGTAIPSSMSYKGYGSWYGATCRGLRLMYKDHPQATTRAVEPRSVSTRHPGIGK